MYNKTPTQYNVSMANALKRCTDGRMLDMDK